ESGIYEKKQCSQISKKERMLLCKQTKNTLATIDSFLDFESAIATKGGIDLFEIDSKTMKSKIIDNLFFAGEIIDLLGPCGGFNLQLCWTTGYLAGKNASL
ncbi:MAG TPA: NAD(P)/FAD-dependent oxidoreductase, partial [Candidatus Pacearchaeota archaeon]|nr:NAD(P)/FAD-dependent oxidoreductase [Candidatus Pacearchaeota archaeon]